MPFAIWSDLSKKYAVKGRLIQDSLHLEREILEGLEDGTDA